MSMPTWLLVAVYLSSSKCQGPWNLFCDGDAGKDFKNAGGNLSVPEQAV